jgi:hypothetical protein
VMREQAFAPVRRGRGGPDLVPHLRRHSPRIRGGADESARERDEVRTAKRCREDGRHDAPPYSKRRTARESLRRASQPPVTVRSPTAINRRITVPARPL